MCLPCSFTEDRTSVELVTAICRRSVHPNQSLAAGLTTVSGFLFLHVLNTMQQVVFVAFWRCRKAFLN